MSRNGTVADTDTSTTRTAELEEPGPASRSDDLTGDLCADKRACVSTTVLRLNHNSSQTSAADAGQIPSSIGQLACSVTSAEAAVIQGRRQVLSALHALAAAPSTNETAMQKVLQDNHWVFGGQTSGRRRAEGREPFPPGRCGHPGGLMVCGFRWHSTRVEVHCAQRGTGLPAAGPSLRLRGIGLQVIAGLPRSCAVSSKFPGIRHLLLYQAAGGSDFKGEICETVTEGAVMLDGSAQVLGSRVFALPGC